MVTFWRLAVIGLETLVLVLLLAGSATSGGFTDYPDLIAEAPGAGHLEIDVWPVGDPADPEDCLVMQQGDCRLLMQFDGLVTNIGEGPLHIEGDPQLSGLGPDQVAQLILDEDGVEILSFPLATPGDDPTNPVIQYETTDGHDHFHLMRIMEYSLWDDTKSIQVAAAEKVGFCLFDVDPIEGFPNAAPQTYVGGGNCKSGDPGATDLLMGTSEGWRDVYSFTIPLQWIDVTDVSPGNYYLAGRADPEGFIAETDETNNGYAFGQAFSTVPGHVAQDTDALVDVTLSSDVAIELGVETYGATIDEDPSDGAQVNVLYPKGDPEFTVESLPTHGTLKQGGGAVTVGAAFTDSTLTYTPDVGYLGADSFTFSVADSMSAFPLNAIVATVSISVAENSPPAILNPGSQTTTSGKSTGIGLTVSDPNGDAVTLTATGLPPGVTVNGFLLSGTPTIPGAYNIVLTAVDESGATDVEAFLWTIDGLLVTPFTDVSATHLFAEDITWMHTLGISLGCGDGTSYCPDDLVTRGQIASFLARAFDLTVGSGADLFTDDDGSVHEDNIDRIATAGVTNGCDVGRFCPDDNLARAQFASLLIRALEDLTGADFSAAVGADYFTDDDTSTHEPNIDKLRYADVTQGCDVGLFCPRDTLTRGQLAALLHRALG